METCWKRLSCAVTALRHSSSSMPKIFTPMPLPRSMYSRPVRAAEERALTADDLQRKTVIGVGKILLIECLRKHN